MIETIQWTGEGVVMIDQTLLPNKEEFFTCRDYKDVAHAIRTMVIRGAPAIGVAAAMGVAIGVAQADPSSDLDAQLAVISAELAGDAADGGQSVLGDRPHESDLSGTPPSAL